MKIHVFPLIYPSFIKPKQHTTQNTRSQAVASIADRTAS